MRFASRLVSGASSRVMRRTTASVDRIRCYSRRLVGQLGAVDRFFFLSDWFGGLGLECSHVWSHIWVSPHIGVCVDREFCGH